MHLQHSMIAQIKQGTIHNSAHFRERSGARPSSFGFFHAFQGAASWLAKSSEVERGGSLRFATKVHSIGEGSEKTRPSAKAAARRHLYKIKYHCRTPQIRHQAAPSRAQAAGAAVIGRPRGAFQRRVARHSPRHRQQRENGGRACRAGHLREWRPLRIAWGLRARLKAQNALSCISGLYLPGPAQGG